MEASFIKLCEIQMFDYKIVIFCTKKSNITTTNFLKNEKSNYYLFCQRKFMGSLNISGEW